MSRLRMVLVGLSAVALTLMLISGGADARANRVFQIPNGSVNGCKNCHVPPATITAGGTARNAFGQTVGTAFLVNGDVNWGAALASVDTDSDGASNGAELQDPNGTWRAGDADPGDATLVTKPWDATSKPAPASGGTPSAGDGGLSWNATASTYDGTAFVELQAGIGAPAMGPPSATNPVGAGFARDAVYAFGFSNAIPGAAGPTVDQTDLSASPLDAGTELVLNFSKGEQDHISFVGMVADASDLENVGYTLISSTEFEIRAVVVDPVLSESNNPDDLDAAFGLIIHTTPDPDGAFNFKGTVFVTDMHWLDLAVPSMDELPQSADDVAGMAVGLAAKGISESGGTASFTAYMPESFFAYARENGVEVDGANCLGYRSYVELMGSDDGFFKLNDPTDMPFEDPGFDINGDGTDDEMWRFRITNSEWSRQVLQFGQVVQEDPPGGEVPAAPVLTALREAEQEMVDSGQDQVDAEPIIEDLPDDAAKERMREFAGEDLVLSQVEVAAAIEELVEGGVLVAVRAVEADLADSDLDKIEIGPYLEDLPDEAMRVLLREFAGEDLMLTQEEIVAAIEELQDGGDVPAGALLAALRAAEAELVDSGLDQIAIGPYLEDLPEEGMRERLRGFAGDDLMLNMDEVQRAIAELTGEGPEPGGEDDPLLTVLREANHQLMDSGLEQIAI